MWFTETPWPPILICCTLMVILAAAWYRNARPRYLAGIAALAVACVAIYVVEKQIVTERERVQEHLYAITTAFQQNDLEGTLEHISPTAREIQYLVRNTISRVEVHDDLRITDVQITLKAEGSRAVCHFRASATVSVGGFHNHGTSRWELTWQREADEWKVIRLRRLDPLSGEEMEPQTLRYRN